MEKKKVVPVWVSVVLTVLCVAGIIFNAYDITLFAAADHMGSILIDIIVCLLYISGLVYCFMGYRKNAAAFFKAFCVLAALSTMSFLYDLASNFSYAATNNIVFISSLLTFSSWCIVAFVSDLGKKQSLITGWVILATTTVTAISMDSTFALVKVLFQVIMCVVFLIMVYAKYADKTARGTK